MASVALAALKRRKGAIKANITKLTTKVAELEAKDREPTILTHAQQLAKRPESLDGDFKTCHFAIIDILDDEEQLAGEQDVPDKHDDEIADLELLLQALMVPVTTPTITPGSHPLPTRDILERWSAQLQSRLVSIHEKIGDIKDDGSDIHLIHLYQEHLANLKRELSELRNEILVITVVASDSLMSSIQKQEDNIFDMSVSVKKLLFLSSASPSSESVAASFTAASGSRSIKLPKIDVPTFDGELLHWQMFWDQFSISIDKRSDISNSEKLVYLHHSLKDGSAKNVIEDLSDSGDQYKEAIDTLKAQYDRPRIIHQTHVEKSTKYQALRMVQAKSSDGSMTPLSST